SPRTTARPSHRSAPTLERSGGEERLGPVVVSGPDDQVPPARRGGAAAVALAQVVGHRVGLGRQRVDPHRGRAVVVGEGDRGGLPATRSGTTASHGGAAYRRGPPPPGMPDPPEEPSASPGVGPAAGPAGTPPRLGPCRPRVRRRHRRHHLPRRAVATPR